jgi:hypothetical protein
MKTLARRFPDEFDKNPIVRAGMLLQYASEKFSEGFNDSLRAEGSTDMEKTRRLMDSWANGIQSPAKDPRSVRSREESESQGR